jgi:hypothetical protein
MSEEERRLESKIIYFEDLMFRCKDNEYRKIEILRKEINDMRIQLQKLKFKRMENGA